MRPALAALLLALALRPAAGQLVTVGPQFVLADYREVASGLRYRGSGVGGALWAGRSAVSAALGLGLDARLAGRLHGTATYAFTRMNRKTNPGGTGEMDAPIQETEARVGLALAL